MVSQRSSVCPWLGWPFVGLSRVLCDSHSVGQWFSTKLCQPSHRGRFVSLCRRYQLYTEEGSLAGELNLALSCLPGEDSVADLRHHGSQNHGRSAGGMVARLERRVIDGAW